MPTPTINTNPHTNKILSSDFRDKFEKSFTPELQIKAIDKLMELIDAYHTISHQELVDSRIAEADRLGDLDYMEYQREHVLDIANWQLCLLLRHSKPTRIREAEPFLRSCIFISSREHAANTIPGKKDPTPTLWLAVALTASSDPAKHAEALKLFDSIFSDANCQPHIGPKTRLWAEAARARVLRKMGKVSMAMKQEKAIATWFETQPWTTSPEAFTALVADDYDPDAHNYVLEHPATKKTLVYIEQMRRNGLFVHSIPVR